MATGSGENCYFLSKSPEVSLVWNRKQSSPCWLFGKGIHVKCDHIKAMPGLNPSLRSPWKNMLKGESFYSSWESVRAWDRTPPHRRELGWSIFQKLRRKGFQTQESFTQQLASFSTWCSNPGRDMASLPTDASNGRGTSLPPQTATGSSPHGVWHLRGDEHHQPPGGPVLFQRRAQDQGSFGVGVVCGQCHKSLILIQRKKKSSLQCPT